MALTVRAPRRVLLTTLVCVASTLASAGTAVGASNFGANIRDNSNVTLYGTRSTITAPGSEINWGSTTGDLFIARVDAEEGFGLIQTGYGETSPSDTFDDCASRSSYHQFQEWHKDLSTANYHCQWGPSVSLNQADQYAVKRIASNPNSCTDNCWLAAVDGTGQITISLTGNFSDASLILSGGEFNVCGDCPTPAPGKTVSIRYGTGSGATDWQRLNSIGGADWTTLTGRTGHLNTDGLWNVPAPPKPFTISHS